MAKAKTPARGRKASARKPAQDADMARKIWLAGIGAYDRMYNETQGAAGKLAKSAGEAFNQLVAKGEEVEESVRARIAASPQSAKATSLMEAWATRAQKLTEDQAAALQSQFGKVSKKVSESLAPWNVAALGQAVERLSGQVDALSKEVTALKTKAPAKRAAPKASASKPAPKRAATTAKPPAGKSKS